MKNISVFVTILLGNKTDIDRFNLWVFSLYLKLTHES